MSENSSASQIAKVSLEQFLSSRTTVIGGLTAAIIAGISYFGMGHVYGDFQTRQLIEAMSPSIQTLCFAVMTATSTIMALMLTMLSLAMSANRMFSSAFYVRVGRIALLSTVALVASTLLLAFVSIPLTESDTLTSETVQIVYYVLIVMTAFLSGLVVSIIIMLFNTIHGVLKVLDPQIDVEVWEG